VIYIQNNLPYAEALENGHSQQAPTGVYANAFHGVLQAYK
ncbi:TPA: HK97 gp10 family phage protein, partial [Escherichia coli]